VGLWAVLFLYGELLSFTFVKRLFHLLFLLFESLLPHGLCKRLFLLALDHLLIQLEQIRQILFFVAIELDL